MRSCAHFSGYLTRLTVNEWFSLNSWRNSKNEFAFDGGYQSINQSMTLLKIIRDEITEECLKARVVAEKPNLEVSSTECGVDLTVICRAWQTETVVCQHQEETLTKTTTVIEGDTSLQDNAPTNTPATTYNPTPTNALAPNETEAPTLAQLLKLLTFLL